MIRKRTKIICTIGPASGKVEILKRLIDAGMDGARLNFSHGTHETHFEYIRNIRKASEECGKKIALVQDLSGPKIRTGKIKGGEAELVEGNSIVITTRNTEGNGALISSNYEGLARDVKKGEPILLDDGKLRLIVTDVNESEGSVFCEVLNGGILKERKGINLPKTRLSLPPLTAKDKTDIEFGSKSGVDIVAMSFVRKADDLRILRRELEKCGDVVPVISKIERPEAIGNIDEIIDSSDMVMVARGDMGVELSTEEVPVLQKMIIRKCNQKIKPVITATQMLESMINSPSPTRAEASDVANAILDGTDCVMLSAETSTGSYPVIAVETMSKIIKKTETIQKTRYFEELFVEDSPENTIHTICNSAVEVATRVKAKAIVTVTHTGKSPLLLSNHRPSSQIISAAYDDSIIKKCKLVWGVESIMVEHNSDFSLTLQIIRDKIISSGLAVKGDKIVLISTMPHSDNESANMILITTL